MEDRDGQLSFADFVDAQRKPLKPKASIHKSGKLGFNSDAAEVLDLESGMVFHLAVPEGSSPEESLLLIPRSDEYPERSKVSVSKAGEYYYIHLRHYFDLAGVSYQENKYRYEIQSETREGVDLYVLTNDMSKPR